MALISILIWTATTLILLYLLYTISGLKKYLEIRRVVNKIPGPPDWPIVGNIPLIVGQPWITFKNVRHVMQCYGPTFRAWIGPVPCVATTSPEDVERFIASTTNITKRPMYHFLYCWLGQGLLTSNGKKWHSRRKVLTPSFHFSILLQFVDIFNKHTEDLVNALKKVQDKEVDVMPFVTDYTLRAICDTAMGTTISENSEELSIYKERVRKFGFYCLQRTFKPICFPNATFKFTKLGLKNKQLVDHLHTFSSTVIQEREKAYRKEIINTKASSLEDTIGKKKMAMLDVLLYAKYNNGEIDDVGIREEVDTFIFEGYDTTSLSLSYTLMLLACNKDCQDKIYEEICDVLQDLEKTPSYNDLVQMKYMERCIKESLRLFPSVPIISRISDGFFTTEGYYVPKGVMLAIGIFEMHRKPELYPDPDKFDPDRFLPENIAKRNPFAYVPFSAGPRNCIGQRFAMLELKAALTAILKNFILKPVDTPETIRLISELVLRTQDGVRVKFESRHCD